MAGKILRLQGLVGLVTPHVPWLTGHVYRLGRKRSKQSPVLSKASIKRPGHLDANCPPISSIIPSNRPFATMPLYTPHPHKQPQNVAPQLSPPMALQRIRFKADQPRHRLALMKKSALKEAPKGKGGQHHCLYRVKGLRRVQ